MPRSVTNWIDQIKAGDHAVAHELWNRYFLKMVCLARKKLQGSPRRAADEEDVALSAFDSFCRGAEKGHFPRLQDRDDLWGLLVVITARKALELMEKEGRKKRGGGRVVTESALAGLDQVIGREPTPEFAAQVAEEFHRLLESLQDTELRSVAVWKMEGHENKDIAAKLKCVTRTVERRLQEIRSIWTKQGLAEMSAPAFTKPVGEEIPEAITLTVTEGPHQGRKFRLAGHATFLVGRSKHAHFQLSGQDRYFSRVHFMVEVNPPQCRLVDMGSRNGTYVNGRKATRADLCDGDRIKAGHTILQVSIPVQASPVQASPVQASPVQASPVQASPVQASPVQASPVQASPVQASPVQASPGDWTPEPLATPKMPPPASPGVSRSKPAEAGPALGILEARKARPGKEPATEFLAFCSACGATSALVKSSPSAFLCPGCLELIRGHPQPVPGYQVIRELGRGAMGVVYLAVEAQATVVALKMITPGVAGTRTQFARFLREAGILRQLDHPNIVAFRDMGEWQGKLYFAMEYVRGRDAAQLIKSQGPLPVSRAVGLVCQLLDALDYAHARGFVHRDIKPSNLMITSGTETGSSKEMVKLADFGLARVYQDSALSGLTMTGDVGGTTAFLPPEQIVNFREAQPTADQYSAAATLYQLLTGRYAHDLPHEFEKQLVMILEKDPVPIRKRRPDIPPDLAAVIHRALDRKPGKRFANVAAMRKALVPFLGL